MIDRENVIKGLTECLNPADYNDNCDCPYNMRTSCVDALHEDALALLKAQEPVEPKLGGNAGVFGTPWYQCGACFGQINPDDKFCKHCGRPVKWE